MKRIKVENIKVGDYIYGKGEKSNDARFIIDTNLKKRYKILRGKLHFLKCHSKKFEPELYEGKIDIDNKILKLYKIYKLNKKEVLEFIKLNILKNLE